MLDTARERGTARKDRADNSLAQLTLVRFREFWREPEAIFWTFIFPILLTAGLGIAFRNRPAEVFKVAAADARIAAGLRADKRLSVDVLDPGAGDVALKTGRIVVFVLPAANGVRYRYDNTNSEARTARLIADRALQHAAGALDPVKTSDELVQERGSRYVDFVVPGLLGMNIMGGGIWGMGFAIVDARRKKLLKRLIASPMRRWEYLLSFLISRVVMLAIEVALFLAFAVFMFGVPLRGQPVALAFLCLFSALAFSALGLLIASRAKTIEAASGLMNFTMLPMWILSGVFFSAERFPASVQPLIRALPLTAVIDALRGNMLQGTGLAQMTWQLPVIAAWLVGGFFIALKLFRWR